MLFMHKGAEAAYLHASFTGTNPKDNESAYYQVDSSNLLTVMRTLQLVLLKLDINPAIHHKLFSILLRAC